MRDRSLDYDLFRRLVRQWREYAPNYLGDHYPLTAHSVDPSVWMAWQFDRPEAGKGMVQAFRRTESVYETARFRLLGLDPGARYALTDLDANQTQTRSGRGLQNS